MCVWKMGKDWERDHDDKLASHLLKGRQTQHFCEVQGCGASGQLCKVAYQNTVRNSGFDLFLHEPLIELNQTQQLRTVNNS